MAKMDKYTAPRQTMVGQESAPLVNDAADVYIPSADEHLDKVKDFYEGKKNIINYAIGGLALLVAGYFAYNYFVKGPKEIKASDSLAMANTFMLMDSTSWMVNGNGSYMGAQKVADQFGGTKAGNMACYMAGVGNLKLGKTKEAIKYLEKFDGKGTMLETIATGVLGDAYWDDNQEAKAVACYEKAGADEDNFQFAPIYLQRAGMIYEKQGKIKEAVAAYTAIKTKFSSSSVARDIDKALARVGVVQD
jgi:predicted negative regulator of RcsB-dependent stress response